MTPMQVPVGDGLFALVDAEDYPVVSRHRWYASQQGGTTYAHRNVTKAAHTVESMHRMVLGPPPHASLVVDHKDGNGLNNCKTNLRFVSKSGNALNQARHRDAEMTGVREVSPGRWTARMVVNKKYRHIGTFDSKDAAVAARRQATTQVFHQGASQ